MKKNRNASAISIADVKFPQDLPRVGVWEIDFSLSPIPFPLPFPVNMIFIVEHDSYFILNMEVISNKIFYLSFREAVFNAVMHNQMLPKSFMVKTFELSRVIRPLTEELGIQCEIVKRLKAIPAVRRDATNIFKDEENDIVAPKRRKK